MCSEVLFPSRSRSGMPSFEEPLIESTVDGYACCLKFLGMGTPTLTIVRYRPKQCESEQIESELFESELFESELFESF